MTSQTTSQSDTIQKPVEFIDSVVADASANGAVIGLSGGIDSTTVAYLAVEALGAENVYGYVLPSSINTSENMSDAEEVAETLGIEYEVIGISGIADAFADAAPEPASDDLAYGNMTARVRGVVLYMYANADNRVVLGTGNRTEAFAGYFTKYGDQAVDCNPIGHLYKGEVRDLAAELGVDEKYITKAPTAGLWEGQTDEDEMGLPYEQLDDVLRCILDDGIEDADEIASQVDAVTAEEATAVIELYNNSAHKRSMPSAPSR